MATKSTRILDPQGRILIPNHIREVLNLKAGNHVEVALEDDYTIRIRVTEARCTICGESVEDKRSVAITAGQGQKHICCHCALKIVKVMEREKVCK